MKRVLDVGNCGPDFASIKHVIEANFDASVEQAHQGSDALSAMEATAYDLVLVNRKLDIDYSDGIDVIRMLKETDSTKNVPVMMVTNFAEHQDLAVKAGAVHGFGKLAIGDAETIDRLQPFLS